MLLKKYENVLVQNISYCAIVYTFLVLFPHQLVTPWSAPNYWGEYENSGVVMSIDETLFLSDP